MKRRGGEEKGRGYEKKGREGQGRGKVTLPPQIPAYAPVHDHTSVRTIIQGRLHYINNGANAPRKSRGKFLQELGGSA